MQYAIMRNIFTIKYTTQYIAFLRSPCWINLYISILIYTSAISWKILSVQSQRSLFFRGTAFRHWMFAAHRYNTVLWPHVQ
jgi:hypothetical protein